MLKNTLRNICYLFLFVSAVAQNTGNSPYSIYGIGDLYRNGFSFNRGMGGLAMGMRKPNTINSLNPASYNSQDSMSFIFDFGASYNRRTLQSTGTTMNNSVVNVDYLAGAFTITKWWASSFGLIPFSRVGYNVSHNDTLTTQFKDTISTRYAYNGSGGIYQAYWGNAFRILNHFSFGFNLSYLFGSINENNSIIYPTHANFYQTYIQKSSRVGNIYYDFGFQYFTNFKEKHAITVGLAFNTISSIHYKQDYIYYKTYYSNTLRNDTLAQSIGVNGKMSIPTNIGFGITYCYDNKILAGFDIYQQKYINTTYPIRVGLEITPNPKSIRHYYERVHYRLGMQYSNSYLKINNHSINDTRLTAGLGLPFSNTKNEFNIALEYGRRGTTEDNLILEHYMLITCSFRFYEFWFFRRKYD
jgi:hypothetical protein